MSLSDLASLGSFVSGVAVVVTLVFLLLQMRQSNINQRALMQQMRSARASDVILKQAEPGIREAMAKAFGLELSIGTDDLRSFVMIQIANLNGWEDTFFQHRLGAIDEASLETDRMVIKLHAQHPAFRATWRMMRETVSADFRRYVDTMVDETTPNLGGDIDTAWRGLMAEELDRARSASGSAS